MADSKSLSAASLAVCRAISSQFKVNSSRVFCRNEARRASLRESIESRSTPEMVAKTFYVAGCRDAASAEVLVNPGKCAMSKRHIRVRCFNWKSRVLLISSRVRSPKIFVSGLWSVTTTKLSQPCVKYLVCSSPQATARGSPSIGA